MKNIIKYAALSLLAVAGITMTSCSSDTRYDVVGNGDNLVYFKAPNYNTYTGTVVHTPVGDFGSLNAEFPVKVQHPLSGTGTITITVDPSLVDAYNAEHNTTYAVLPESAVTMENKTINVSPNKTDADDTLRVSLNEAALASLTEKAYMMAVRLQANGGGMKGSEERGVGYLIINTEEKLIKTISSADEMNGTVLTDYSGWTAKYDTGTEADAAQLFDGDLTNGAALRTDGANGTSTKLIVDMQTEKSVIGLRVSRYYRSLYGGWWIDEYYFSGVKVEMSKDGVEWTEIGAATEADMPKANGYQYICLYGGVPARYLRFTFDSGSSSVSSLAELGVYTAN